MTNAFLTWTEKETGILKSDAIALEPAVIAWAKNFLSGITPIIIQAAENAVAAAVSVPGDGAIKGAAALAAATAELASQGIPVIESDLKAAIHIAYTNLPPAVASNAATDAVIQAAGAEIDKVGTDLASDISPSPAPAPAAA